MIKNNLYTYEPWILLFQMVYERNFFLNILTEKPSVYDHELDLSLLGALSQISTASYFLSLISTLIQNPSETLFLIKQVFYGFSSGNEQRSLERFCRAYQDLL